jgi:tetratricopeptide (TPR) repeat protein
MLNIDDLWDYGNPAGTEEKFRAVLPKCATQAERAELLTQIARTHSLRRQFTEAHQILDEAHTLITNLRSRAQVRYLLERGRTFNSAQHKPQASELFLQAWNLARELAEESLAVDAAHMLGISERPEKQLEWNLLALAYAEQTVNPEARKWLGPLYNNLGWTYHTSGHFEKALEMFERGLAFRREGGQVAETHIAQWCVARCLRSLGRVAEALALQEALLAEHNAHGTRDGYVFEELGECLLALNRAAEARPYFAQAYAELSPDAWLTENEAARLERLKQLSS